MGSMIGDKKALYEVLSEFGKYGKQSLGTFQLTELLHIPPPLM